MLANYQNIPTAGYCKTRHNSLLSGLCPANSRSLRTNKETTYAIHDAENTIENTRNYSLAVPKCNNEF